MINEGIELMAIGMGVVLFFLILLVAFMYLSGALFTRFSHLFPDSKPPAPPAQQKPADSSAKLAVAIAAAAANRKRHGS